MNKKIYLLLIMQKIISGIINFSLVIFLTSNLSAKEYGIYLVYSSILIAISNIFFQWKVNVIQRYYVFNRNLVINYIIKNIIKAILLICMLSIIIIFIIKLYGYIVGIIIIFSAVSTGILLILMQILNAEQNHLLFIKATTLKSVSLILISYGVWVSFQSINGLIFGIGISGLITIIYILKNYKIKYKKRYSDTKHIWNYGKYFLVISISTVIIDYFDKIIMSKILGYADTGSYGAAQMIIQQIIGAILSIIYMYWSPKIIQESTAGYQNNVEIFYKKLEIYTIIIGGITIALIGLIFFNIKINETVGNIQNSYTTIFIMLTIYTGCIKGFLVDFRLLLLKDSKYIFLNTFIGAMIAIILSYYLINIYGIIGASISSFLSFYISMLIGLARLKILKSNGKNDWILITSPFIFFIPLFILKTFASYV